MIDDTAVHDVNQSVGAPSVARPAPTLRTRAVYYRDVTLHLVRRDFATRHRGSLLGWFWALAPTLLQLVVTYFVFTKVLRQHVPNYPVFLLTGLLCWNWFARGLVLGTVVLESRRELVLRPGFPTPLLPVSAVLIGLLDYLLTLPVLLVAIAFGPGLTWTALLLPVPVLIQLALLVGCAWILSPLQVFFRDVAHFVGIAVLLGFWITPIWYTTDQVPSRYSIVYELNPMTHLIDAQRALLPDGELPAGDALGWVALAALVTCLVGYAVFAHYRPTVPEQL